MIGEYFFGRTSGSWTIRTFTCLEQSPPGAPKRGRADCSIESDATFNAVCGRCSTVRSAATLRKKGFATLKSPGGHHRIRRCSGHGDALLRLRSPTFSLRPVFPQLSTDAVRVTTCPSLAEACDRQAQWHGPHTIHPPERSCPKAPPLSTLLRHARYDERDQWDCPNLHGNLLDRRARPNPNRFRIRCRDRCNHNSQLKKGERYRPGGLDYRGTERLAPSDKFEAESSAAKRSAKTPCRHPATHCPRGGARKRSYRRHSFGARAQSGANCFCIEPAERKISLLPKQAAASPQEGPRSQSRPTIRSP